MTKEKKEIPPVTQQQEQTSSKNQVSTEPDATQASVSRLYDMKIESKYEQVTLSYNPKVSEANQEEKNKKE